MIILIIGLATMSIILARWIWKLEDRVEQIERQIPSLTTRLKKSTDDLEKAVNQETKKE